MGTHEEFRQRLLDATDAEVRKRGRGWFRLFSPRTMEERGNVRAAWATAIGEAGDRFTPAEREAFLADGRLPEWFRPWVAERATYWRNVVDGRA